ncbi:MAG TPA: PAS domain S-box protein [Blastocatellia bacterium]|nr:PAS domain S-box protein [Blastocatellia bacterium]
MATSTKNLKPGELDVFLSGGGEKGELRQTEEELTALLVREREAREEAETLNQITRAFASELDLQKLAQSVTDTGAKLTGAKFGAFFYNVVNEQGEAYMLYTQSGAAREAFEKFGIPLDTAIFERTFRGLDVVRSDDILKHPGYDKNPPHHGLPRGHLPVRSYLAVPVVSRSGASLGRLFFGHSEPGIFTERAERVAVDIAGQAAVAIDNAHLLRSLRESEERSRQAGAELAGHVAELQRLNIKLQDARRAAFNMMEDAVRAKEALRESEERFRMLADNAPVLIWVSNPTGCEFVNYEYLKFLGVNEAEVLGDGWATFIHSEDREDYVKAYHEALSRRGRFEAEFRFLRRDGEYRWMQSVGMPRFEGGEFKGYVGSSSDIHERKLAEKVMAQMAAIVESSDEAIISKDLNGIILSWNEGAEKLFGYTTAEVIGKPVTILIPPDRAYEEPLILERLRRGEQVDHYETVRRRKDGSDVDISLTISPIRDKSGKVVAASKIARNITDRKRIENEREEILLRESAARAEAEAANRSKDEFLAVVSHELRSPLNAILGYNRMLRENPSDAARLKQSCDIIERNAKTQLQLIEDLLDTARIVSGKLRLELRPLDINPVVADALNVVRPAAEDKGVQLQIAIADCGLPIADSQLSDGQKQTTAPVESENRDRTAHGENQSAIRNPQSAIVLGDVARLQQIIWNLLSNAIKFTPAGGCVELRAERSEEHIRIVVSDTGKGIQPEFLPYIFDRFRQDDSSGSQRYGGLGLGLALVKHLVELHGGRVEAASEGAECGSTFTVTLPLATQIELVSAEPPALAMAAGANGAAQTEGAIPLPTGITIAGVRVLVVDDQEEARASLTGFLNRYGAVVTTASSGAEALAILSDPPDGARPDLLICDLAMPEEDGYAALRRVRALEEAQGVAASQQIPAIALTSLTRNEDRLRAVKSGFKMHVAKPVDPVELIIVIDNITGRWRRKAGSN